MNTKPLSKLPFPTTPPSNPFSTSILDQVSTASLGESNFGFWPCASCGRAGGMDDQGFLGRNIGRGI
ncbi:unnamed protein product [Moneuplotes crassus]|uniref:Uncharacterized protein n=1 Tax=Euplotes crassus TaxID=5936 RepID=A0AAD1XNU4_EUPCR|nr:unnamed protein product [Moneuplotes crassus]